MALWPRKALWGKPCITCESSGPTSSATWRTGAWSSAVLYSLIETAEENGLDTYRYLVWLLGTAPTLASVDQDWGTKLTPGAAPLKCHIPPKN